MNARPVLAAALCAAAGFLAGRVSAPAPEVRTVSEVVERTVTLQVRTYAEAERKDERTEKVVRRRYAPPPPGAPAPAAPVLAEETVVERAARASRTLKFDVSDLRGYNHSSAEEKREIRPPAWSVDVAAGYSFGSRRPVVGVGVSRDVMRLRLGVWAATPVGGGLKPSAGGSIGFRF